MPKGSSLYAALQLARDALEHSESECRYHGTDLERMGTEPWSHVGLPRCDSCKQPWRVMRALAAVRQELDYIDRED